MRTATPTISISATTDGGFRATATFPPGLFASRRPVIGDPSASVAGAIGNLLASPGLALTLHKIVTA